MSQTFDNRGPGGWRGTDTLEMGTGKTGARNLYTVCEHCGVLKNVGITTVGIICNNCNKYFSIKKRYNQKQLSEEIEKGNIKTNESVEMPHLRIEGKNEYYKFRQEMEEKAYQFKDEQIKKRKSGEPQRYHGPIDSQTGKRIK
jgi:hypothetical protein